MVKKKTWRDLYRIHPAAELFPMMTDEELDDLAADIRKNGLAAPVMFWTDNREYAACHEPQTETKDDDCPVYLLDGRNRMEAIERAGFTLQNVPTQTYPTRRTIHAQAMRAVSDDIGSSWRWVAEVDPYTYVMASNIKRRHLTAKQKRDLIAALLKLAPERSDRQVAKDVGVSHTTVATVRELAESTGQIGQFATRTGADGKTRRQPAGKPRPKAPPSPQAVIRQLTKSTKKWRLETAEQLRALQPDDAARAALLEYRNDGPVWDALMGHVFQKIEPLLKQVERAKLYIELEGLGSALEGVLNGNVKVTVNVAPDGEGERIPGPGPINPGPGPYEPTRPAHRDPEGETEREVAAGARVCLVPLPDADMSQLLCRVERANDGVIVYVNAEHEYMNEALKAKPINRMALNGVITREIASLLLEDEDLFRGAFKPSVRRLILGSESPEAMAHRVLLDRCQRTPAEEDAA